MRRFDAILFDLGGTLTYFDGDWDDVVLRARIALYKSLVGAGLILEEAFADAFHQSLLYYYRERDTDLVEHSTIFVLQQLLEQWGYPEVSDTIVERAIGAFHVVTQSHWFVEADVINVLTELQKNGYRLGLISNAADDADVQSQVDKAQIRRFFEIILTSAGQGIRKPDPKIFHSALAKMDVVPEKAVMVGDTLRADVLGAKNAGIFSIWITKWADNPLNRADAHTISPDEKVADLKGLPQLMKKLESEYVK